ncbi:receptor-like protein EIX1 [Gossypium arboreum]|uniref:receptor-like protein EIX1 n=1 Tax=Gossypium arboreum TaxID=29729 RepID=UPI0022F18DB9|nr:receptor-like protein EIX1 [Gossypium arboreum]
MAIATMTTPLPISLFPFLLLIPAFCFTICHANSDMLCIQSERALLKFKNHIIDPSNRLSSWVEGGVAVNGLVLSAITQQATSTNCTWLLFQSLMTLHRMLIIMGEARKKFLGGRRKWGAGAHACPPGFAPTDYEWEAYYNSLLVGKINPSLLELKHLSSLDLSNNNFSSIQIPKFFGFLESLTYLNLSRARFQGEIPHNLGNLSKLQFLDLGGNDLKSESLQWVSGLSSLQYLDLSSANLSKANDWPVQVTFILSSLLELHLKSCGLEDDPTSISVNSSKSLLALDLFWNRLTSGPIPDYFGNISFLEVLDLSINNLNSSIPNSLYSLNRLQFLSLSDNHLQGKFYSAIGNLSSVTHLDLSSNLMLEGRLPTSLEYLYGFLYNLLDGAVLETHFSNLTRLTTPNASHNRLTFEPNSSWIPPFQCRIIELGHWHLGPVFPPWLKFQKKLHHLDISYAGISDVIPL